MSEQAAVRLELPGKEDLGSVLRRRWSSRSLYARPSDWLLSLYTRLLLRGARLPLPGRGKVMRVRLHGEERPLFVRLGTTDWFSLEDAYAHRVYQPLLDRRPGEIRTVVDLGSNIGFTLRLWQTHFPSATLVGVEPDDANLVICRLNLLPEKVHGAPGAPGLAPATRSTGAGRFRPYSQAVSTPGQAVSTPGQVRLLRACAAGSERTVSLDGSAGEWALRMRDASGLRTVPALPLPRILEEAGLDGTVDLLKCVIMGAETELFADCGAWIRRVRHLVLHLYRDSYSTERFFEDVRRGGAAFDLYHHVRYGEQSELLFLERRGE